MTTTADQVTLDFPLATVTIADHHVAVHIDRDQLPRLEAFLAALRLGLVDAGIQPAGHG